MKKFFSNISIILGTVLLFAVSYSCKKEEKKPFEEVETQEVVVSPYAQLLEKTPVYKDSIYAIYLTTMSGVDKIIYLKEGELTSVQEESKFFLHIYPTDKELLGETKTSSLIYDFKNNASEFSHLGTGYHVSETDLPEIDIDKINTGQYGYQGDSSINWRISKILTTEAMRPIIQGNNDDVVLRIEN